MVIPTSVRYFLLASASIFVGMLASQMIQTKLSSVYIQVAVSTLSYVVLSYMVLGSSMFKIMDVLSIMAIFLLTQTYQTKITKYIQSFFSKMISSKTILNAVSMSIEALSGGFLAISLSCGVSSLINFP